MRSIKPLGFQDFTDDQLFIIEQLLNALKQPSRLVHSWWRLDHVRGIENALAIGGHLPYLGTSPGEAGSLAQEEGEKVAAGLNVVEPAEDDSRAKLLQVIVPQLGADVLAEPRCYPVVLTEDIAETKLRE